MKIPQLIAAEFRRLTSNPMAVVALVALMCVPVLYGALYLWANQDPYAELHRVPAAIVVDDEGVSIGGSAIDYGEKVAEQLVHDDSFDWHIVTPGTAATGVDSSRYDFSITFPRDFSAALASASGRSPRQATVTLTTNDANSYLATTIGTQTAEKIRTSIVQQVNQEAANRFLLSIARIRGNLATAAHGAGKLADGIKTARSGAATLATGTRQLSSGSTALASGLSTLKQQTAQLPAQTAQLAAGAAQVAAGDQEIAGLADRAGTTSQQAASSLPQARADIKAQITERLQQQGMSSTQAQAEAERIVSTYLDPLGAKITEGNATDQNTVGRVDRHSAGADQVSAGAARLAAGTPALTSGISDAASGASRLASGSAQAASGAAALHHVFPMSYTVDAMRQLMYGGSLSTAWADAGVLGIWLGTALVFAAIGVTRMTHFRTLRDLQPSLIG
jgi:putative membrane protein